MKLISLYIKKFKKFSDKWIYFNKHELDEELIAIYGNANITALIGENGIGKTTILSLIVLIFRYLQRDQDKLPTDFSLTYEINKENVTIEYINNSVFITIKNIKKLLLEMQRKNRKNLYALKKHQNSIQIENVTFDEVRKYIPTSVIASGFDIDYNVDYPSNLICDKFVKLNNNHYFSSSVGLYVSGGICKFFHSYFNKNNSLSKAFDRLSITIQPYVKVRLTLPYLFDSPKSEEHTRMKRIEVLDGFYIPLRQDKFINLFKDIDYLAKKHNLSSRSLLINIFNKTVFNDFILGTYDGGFNWKFDLGNFMQTNQIYRDIIYMLVENNALYVNDIFLTKNDRPEYSIEKMSTGEKIIFGRVFNILSHIKSNSIIIIEEPEIHLNYNWVKQLISILLELFKDYPVHLLLSSHNYSFVNNLQSEQVLLLTEDKIKKPDHSIFLANEDYIGQMLNNNIHINSLIEDHLENIINKDDTSLIKYFFEITGESYLKLILFKKLVSLGEIDVESIK
jgi:ABC-type Mn2+/Zn2+ transport system ATPase subunit